MSNEKLYFRKMGSGRPLVILHGLFGSSDNWLSIGKALSEEYEVFLVDQRNHGQSFHSNDHNYEVLAQDLLAFLKDPKLAGSKTKPILIGHSMGGKTAMTFALGHPDALEKLVVVDISPRGYNVHHDSILDGLKSINLTDITTRKEADEVLAKSVPELGVRQFLLKNLARSGEGFEWKLNLDALEKNLERIVEEVKGEPAEIPALFMKGEHSNYIRDTDKLLISKLFPNSTVVTIHDAGHWVHAEQPEAFLETLKSFLS